ncbi:uncharacterized protein LOC119739102 [Patiria miniata]|uniref:EGF-like domain-containing protein n=1 Tax=Patiria miniata TaxID=46514 RepID=A0A914B1J1_PATMI|nr:uncharacterized protein LOC119739102 [Patiria miniata]
MVDQLKQVKQPDILLPHLNSLLFKHLIVVALPLGFAESGQSLLFAIPLISTLPGYTKISSQTPNDATVAITNGYCDCNPCQNDGTCWTLQDGSYQCLCTFGYEGEQCQNELYPDADYSTLHEVPLIDLFNVLSYENPRENPFYQLAAYYNTLETKFAANLLGSGAEIIEGRIGQYYRLIGAHSWLNPVFNAPGVTCVEQGLAGCDRGLAVSLWVLLEQEALKEEETVLFYSGTNVDEAESPHLGIFIDANKRMKFQVNDGDHVWTVTVSSSSLPLGSWCNLAMTWRPASDLHAYINSYKVGTLDVVPSQRQSTTVPPPSSSPWVVTLGSRGQRSTTSPMAVSDLVIWDRFLYDFERHRFLGVTADELQVLHGADYLWTTDGYLRRDQVALLSQHGIAATGPIAYSSKPAQVPGRDDKGWAMNVDGVSDQWLALGDFADTCVSDPSLCPDGITFALWVKVHRPVSVGDTSFAFIFSTGGQSSRGCALYQHGGNRLRATVADGRREWIVEVKFVSNDDHWVHLAISWRQSLGLVLYIDGNTHGRDRTGHVRLRHHDLDSRLLVGRRNDYLAGFANVTLEWLAIWEHYIEPWEARREMGLVENDQYATATYYWNQQRFISSTFDILANSGGTEGPSGDVTVPYADVVDLSSPGAYLNLGDFMGRCVTDPTKCSTGLSVSLWLRYQHGIKSSKPSIIIRTRDLNGKDQPGFVMFVLDAVLWLGVQSSPGRWFASLEVEHFPNDIWTNVAFTWSEARNLVLYINGFQFTGRINYRFEPKSISPNPTPQLIVGATSTPTPSHPVTFQVHSLAIWESYIERWNINQLLGMSKSELYCFKYGDYCWSFEPTLRLRHPFELSPAGATFTSDRRDQGTALCTDGRSGWISLGDFSAQCPARPSACEHGFIVAMWVKLTEVTSHRRSGYLLSVGAEEQGESGLSLFQSITGIRAKVVDDNLSWETNIKSSWLTFDRWIYLTIKWTGQILVIDIGGEELPTTTHIYASSFHGANTHFKDNTPLMTLGKSIHDNRGFLAACYDDVLLLLPKRAGEDLPYQNSSVQENENQFKLDEPGPETAREECKIIHEADCATTIEELLYVVG